MSTPKVSHPKQINIILIYLLEVCIEIMQLYWLTVNILRENEAIFLTCAIFNLFHVRAIPTSAFDQ